MGTREQKDAALLLVRTSLKFTEQVCVWECVYTCACGCVCGCVCVCVSVCVSVCLRLRLHLHLRLRLCLCLCLWFVAVNTNMFIRIAYIYPLTYGISIICRLYFYNFLMFTYVFLYFYVCLCRLHIHVYTYTFIGNGSYIFWNLYLLMYFEIYVYWADICWHLTTSVKPRYQISTNIKIRCHMNESCIHTHEWIMSHANELCHIWMSHVTYEWVTSVQPDIRRQQTWGGFDQ